jgi:SAM-dependent methyltransferase
MLDGAPLGLPEKPRANRTDVEKSFRLQSCWPNAYRLNSLALENFFECEERSLGLHQETKPIFIVSSGRSGTQMMQRLFERFPSVEAHHEYLCTHVQPLAVKYVHGLLERKEVVERLAELHGSAISLSPKPIWIDSSNKLSWLIGPLRELFPTARFVHLVRDGRKVVSSFFHKLKDECYDDASTAALQAWIDEPDKHPMPPPEKKYWWNAARPGTEDGERFRTLDQFGRICRHWVHVHQVIFAEFEEVSQSHKRFYRLEDLHRRPDLVCDLLEFIGLDYTADDFWTLQRPHNVSRPEDYLLSPEQQARFDEIAGSMMERLGYGHTGEYRVVYHPPKPSLEPCHLCGCACLEPLWRSETTCRDLTVFYCPTCGLVQSLPRIDHVPEREVAVSGGANWGNLRYGKAFRTKANIDLIEQWRPLRTIRRCLDVGSNRGTFSTALVERAPKAEIMAVEPDEAVAAELSVSDRLTLKIARIEDVELPQSAFDLVHCSHTLEHLASPLDVLRQLRQAMTPDGLLLVEVPHLAFIGRDDVLEEWFIDKHLYHFSRSTLIATLRAAGFEILEGSFRETDANLAVLASPLAQDTKKDQQPAGKSDEGTRAFALIRRYGARLDQNRRALRQAARQIESLARSKKTIIWGAGRIFDSLVTIGRLDTSLINGVIDRELPKYVTSVHGQKLQYPKAVPAIEPEVAIIASREFAVEIAAELACISPGCRAMTLSGLIQAKGVVPALAET